MIGNFAQRCKALSQLPLGSNAMDWDVTEVRLAGEFSIFVRFKDGAEGMVKFLPSFLCAGSHSLENVQS